jgi:hypothetical protein
VALGALAVAVNLAVYSSLDDSEPFVQAVSDIPAGERITTSMVRTVDADLDGSVNAVPGDRIDLVVGQYAKVRIVSGSLVTDAALQTEPLVSVGNSVVAVQLPEGSLPIGLRERAPIHVVIPSRDGEAPAVIVGRVVGLPSSPDTLVGVSSLSVEVATGEAAAVAAADEVRIVLLEPAIDPAATNASTQGLDEPSTEASSAEEE